MEHVLKTVFSQKVSYIFPVFIAVGRKRYFGERRKSTKFLFAVPLLDVAVKQQRGGQLPALHLQFLPIPTPNVRIERFTALLVALHDDQRRFTGHDETAKVEIPRQRQDVSSLYLTVNVMRVYPQPCVHNAALLLFRRIVCNFLYT